MFIGAIIHALLLFSANAVSGNDLTASGSANLRASAASPAVHNQHGCDETCPLAPPPRNTRRGNTSSNSNNEHHEHQRRLVAIPPAAHESGVEYYETGQYYAPLCPDGRRIDLRELVRCVNDQCFDEEIGHCTYVCSWSKLTPLQTRQPTMRPTPAPEVTDHPLLMDLRNLPKIYRMDEEVRAAIIQYMRDRLEFDLAALGLGLELVELSSPGRLPGRPHALPLKLEVSSPPDISDFALSYIMQTMSDANEEILKHLKRLDGDGSTYKDVTLNFSTYNPSEIKDVTLNFSTYEPSDIIEANTLEPSKSPTPSPTAPPKVKNDNKVVALDVESEKTGIAWWVWLIILLITLILCCCCCYCWKYRRSKRANDKSASFNQQTVNLSMQSRVTPKKLKKKKKDESKKYLAVDSRRPPRSVAPRPTHRPNPRDDHTRRTSRTKRSHHTRNDRTRRTSRTHKTSQTHYEVPAPATSIVIHEIANQYKNLETIQSSPESQTNVLYDAETAVSAISAAHDPPEEGHHAMVLYNPQPNEGIGRDPTMYTDRAFNPEQAEPEGDKIMKKQSMFATGELISEVHREKERKDQAKRESAAAMRRRSKRRGSMGSMGMGQRLKESTTDSEYDGEGIEPPSETMGFESEDDRQRYSHENSNESNDLFMTSEPEGLTSDEVMVEKVNTKRSSTKKKKSKKKKKKQPGAASRVEEQQTKPVSSSGSLDRLKSSFNWRAPQNADGRSPAIDIDMESNDSGYDSPSILTSHNPSGGDQTPAEDNPYYRNDYDEEHGEGSHHHARAKQSSSGGGSLFASIRLKSMDFVRDGISSNDDESFHVETEEENDHHGNRHQYDQGIQRRESSSSYGSV